MAGEGKEGDVAAEPKMASRNECEATLENDETPGEEATEATPPKSEEDIDEICKNVREALALPGVAPCDSILKAVAVCAGLYMEEWGGSVPLHCITETIIRQLSEMKIRSVADLKAVSRMDCDRVNLPYELYEQVVAIEEECCKLDEAQRVEVHDTRKRAEADVAQSSQVLKMTSEMGTQTEPEPTVRGGVNMDQAGINEHSVGGHAYPFVIRYHELKMGDEVVPSAGERHPMTHWNDVQSGQKLSAFRIKNRDFFVQHRPLG